MLNVKYIISIVIILWNFNQGNQLIKKSVVQTIWQAGAGGKGCKGLTIDYLLFYLILCYFNS